ncbi:cytosolic endo-beta-N-acetylglucosaminidase-like [Amblyomma americanum]
MDVDTSSTSSSDSSSAPRGGPPSRLQRGAKSGLVTEPLEKLDDLLDFTEAPLVAVEALREVKRGNDPQASRTLFCHDMMGGYLEDRFIHGCAKADAYRFHHWQIINTFVYYSHHMVTIPPPGWTSAGHRHGVQVLGTFTLEGDTGLKTFNMIHGRQLEQQVGSQLARVAVLYKFDGWLINIGFQLAKNCVRPLQRLVSAIAEQTHKAVLGSLVIWYDSVIRDGQLSPQNELNANNAGFFQLCDGILLNFRWKESRLKATARYARDRKNDVYVGIDVFSRDTEYEGGYDTYKAVEAVRKHGLSAGIFAAGWVYETQGKAQFTENQYRLWSFPDHCCPEWRVTTLPLRSSFCQGFGDRLCRNGKVTSSLPWFNLCKQQLQPRDQGTWPCGNGSATAMVHTKEAYNGGGCLRLQYEPGDQPTEDKPYFRLFGCDMPLGSLVVTYAVDESGAELFTGEVAVVLTVTSVTGEKEQILLGISTTVPDEKRYAATRHQDPNAVLDTSSTNWATRKYYVRDLSDCLRATLKEVGIGFLSTQVRHCLLGQIVIERPHDDKSGADTLGVDANDSNEGLDDPALDAAADNDAVPPEKRMRF